MQRLYPSPRSPFGVSMLSYTLIQEAADRLKKRVRRTELIHSHHFSEKLGFPLSFKCENLQRTGSFKIRGALNFMTAQPRDALAGGVITASAGNHAQGVAFSADILGVGATVYMPETTPPQKVFATRDYGAEVVLAGQGTIGLEIIADLPDLATLLVPIGGGGLIAGIATAIKELRPEVRIIGVEAKAAPSMHFALEKGRVVEVPLTVSLADGIAVKRV